MLLSPVLCVILPVEYIGHLKTYLNVLVLPYSYTGLMQHPMWVYCDFCYKEHFNCSFSKSMQRDLLAMLIAPSGITQPDLRSAVYEAVGRDDSLLKAIEG